MATNLPSLAERLAAMHASNSNLIKCDKCGSIWFTEMSFAQYSKAAYSATVGGDISRVGTQEFQLRICLCGEPYRPNIGGVRPGRIANNEQDSFLNSLKVAKDYRERLQNVNVDTSLSDDFVPRTEFEKAETALKAAEETIATINRRVELLRQVVEAGQKTAPAKAEKTKSE